MNDKKIQALYGLKWNPFLSNVPVEALWKPPGFTPFFFRLENLVMDGGFALICGEPGLGKSKILQLLENGLSDLGDVTVGVMERPQSSLSDFYREMGELFGVELTPSNRYGGFKSLRSKWQSHIRSTLFRSILLIDEAQEMATQTLNELRLLQSVKFDSESLLTIVICGDNRLPERFRSNALVSLGSRTRVRLIMKPYERETLLEYLEYALEKAGACHLMTKSLKGALVDHSAGNLRLLNSMSTDLLERAAQKELKQLDDKLFFEVFSLPSRRRPRKKADTKNE
jgi:general secretion pathway protein A